jgi:hypothetical protein
VAASFLEQMLSTRLIGKTYLSVRNTTDLLAAVNLIALRIVKRFWGKVEADRDYILRLDDIRAWEKQHARIASYGELVPTKRVILFATPMRTEIESGMPLRIFAFLLIMPAMIERM